MFRTLVAVFLFVIMGAFATELIPLPRDIKVNKEKVILGKKLFFDPILSKDGTLSCASCHNLRTNGAGNVQYTKGIEGKQGAFNVPTVYNAVYNFRQFWDGRAKDLKDQAFSPIINPIEMGNNTKQVIKDLKNSHYNRLFQDIYKDGVSKENISEVLAEFEKTLRTPNALFDKYLRDDSIVIDEEVIRGYRLFKEKGCISCHNGINIGGNLYNKFGIYEDAKSKELGRYNLTKEEEDRYVFKVPSLRNVALTAPYMHDGRIKTLKEAVNLMAEYQLGRKLNKEDLGNVVAFLKALTGEIPFAKKNKNDKDE